jgi:hypothetical protein
MKIQTTVATALAVALLAANTSAVEVKNLIQKNSRSVRAQTAASLELSASLFAKLRAQFAAKAATEEEAFNSIALALLSVEDVQECVEAELAADWGITSTLQCFAPPEEPAQVSFCDISGINRFQ